MFGADCLVIITEGKWLYALRSKHALRVPLYSAEDGQNAIIAGGGGGGGGHCRKFCHCAAIASCR